MHVDNNFHDESQLQWQFFFIILIRHISISLFFFAWFSIKKLYIKQQEIESIKTKEQQAQLRMLKGQINPHFLFNTLNTIYASALNKDDMTPDLILKLSDNFRYLLHEGQENVVPLNSEIQHLKDYVNLQKERWASKVIIKWNEKIDEYMQKIPPLLLISFVENAFKYSSMLTGKNHEISLSLQLQEKQFSFRCENNFNNIVDKEIDSNWRKSGIGIENTKKRLQLLFPNKHNLSIGTDKQKFTVDLSIAL
jgi:LytS/YehU family sensor histidine kinase